MKIETGRWFNTKTWKRKGLIIKVEDQDDFSSLLIVYIDYRSADKPTSDEFTIPFKNNELIDYKPTQQEVHSALKFIFTDWELLE